MSIRYPLMLILAILSACTGGSFRRETAEKKTAEVEFSFTEEFDSWSGYFKKKKIDFYPIESLWPRNYENFPFIVEQKMNDILKEYSTFLVYIRQNIHNSSLDIALIVQENSTWRVIEWIYPDPEEVSTVYNSDIIDTEKILSGNEDRFLLYNVERLAIGSSSYYILVYKEGRKTRIAGCFLESEISTVNDIDEIVKNLIVNIDYNFSMILLGFSIMSAVVLTVLSKRYRRNDKPILLVSRRIRFSVYRHHLTGMLFCFSFYFLIISMVKDFRSDTIYANSSTALIDLFIHILLNLTVLGYMFQGARFKLFSVWNRIPNKLRIIGIIVLMFSGRIIHETNMLY